MCFFIVWSGREFYILTPYAIDKYFELLHERKIKGYLFEEKNYFANGSAAGKSK